jgi:hypothetical protein
MFNRGESIKTANLAKRFAETGGSRARKVAEIRNPPGD